MLITEAAERLSDTTRQEGAGPRLRRRPRLWKEPSLQGLGPPFPSAEDADCAPGLVSLRASHQLQRGGLGLNPGGSRQERTLACRRTARKPTGIESQQEEEPGWAGPGAERPAGPTGPQVTLASYIFFERGKGI